ncbi:transmembrane protease serine 9-like [Culex pipiens pallens]|uniref:transmembrane protease serine 9-like n=1 Tax=Culex pipiens pallens TaxID=42434 RepID=UPI0022AA4C12|nr:transmembrane protease serine 9-like [Culex pipiens pallens]
MKFYLAVVPFLLLLVPTRQQGSWISSNECGIRKVKTSDGQWPWHVAVYRATPTNRTMEYTCGGTLISEKFVLTAGQCVLDEYLNLLNSNLFAVRLGVFDLERLSLRFGRFRRVVHTFVTYGVWENGSSIALLELGEGVQFGDYVQPICVYQGFLEDIGDGTMAGWSSTRKQPDVLKSSELSVMHPSKCSELSQWLLCAEISNGTIVNKAATGGGFFVERDNIWYLVGVLIQLPQGQTYVGFQGLTQHIQFIKMITDISYLEEIKTLKISTDQPMPPSAPDYANRLPKQCGNFIPSRVYDDFHSEVYEFPWIALVGYRRLHYTYLPYFSCTGTLINRRYVLTSGACVSHGKINVVRLGEQEIGNHRDCDLIDKNDCALVVQDYDVEHFIKHHSHDIGLIRLAGNVVYEGTKPFCSILRIDCNPKIFTSSLFAYR